MSLLAFVLVVIAAFTHASWNLLAKRAAHCRHFNWYYSSGAALIFMPLAAYALVDFAPRISSVALLVLLSSCVLHALYSECLQRGYRAADLSVVYPVARGTGPLVSFVGAIFVLREHPSLIATAGALSVVAGVLVLAGGRRLWRELRGPREARGTLVAGLYWGGLTGLLIASYTLNDGYAVKVLLVPPLLVDYAGNLFRSLVLAPAALRDRVNAAPEFRRFWKEAIGVAILGPTGYILVLYAMTMAPVSHVAPAREMSMMIGAWFGARLLGEGRATERVFGAGLIVAGVAALALG